ncbi:F-box protein-like [Iris pallida]|uniref:F-box protein-like n=1 Tax=Iris pallida TaxID=29817 RepID=A0AAX6DK56_IRIPA|nr:F-box protein-like [Iris pallida]
MDPRVQVYLPFPGRTAMRSTPRPLFGFGPRHRAELGCRRTFPDAAPSLEPPLTTALSDPASRSPVLSCGPRASPPG